LRSMVIAFVVLGLTLLFLGFWAAGLDRDPERFAAKPAPPITILEPADGDTVGTDITLVFETPAPLRLTPSGWLAGRLHVHANVNGVELMPAAADMEEVGKNRFAWRLLPQRPGPATIRMEWATPDHRAVEAGGSPEIRVFVREPEASGSQDSPN